MKQYYDVDTVIFDCDSTLSTIEGIDELARRVGVYEKFAPLTDAAMSGEITLQEVYRKRLELIRPNRSDIEWLGTEYIAHCLADVPIVIDCLQKYNKQVHIVSSGIRQAVLILAEYLGIEANHVHAVNLRFDEHDQYAGFDNDSPLSMNNGKKIICHEIVADNHSAVMIGDGMTDVEAEQDRISVIGFGGVVNRDSVRNRTKDFIETTSLMPLLERLLRQSELATVGHR